jgi:hypothetical protein
MADKPKTSWPVDYFAVGAFMRNTVIRLLAGAAVPLVLLTLLWLTGGPTPSTVFGWSAWALAGASILFVLQWADVC